MKLETRMKQYESMEAGRKFTHLLPICVRVDGKCFSKFTRSLPKPYDPNLSKLMILTASRLAEETNACIAYTQSDEISLLYYSSNIKSEPLFGGKIQKLVSILASLTTAYFNSNLATFLPDKVKELPIFDARAWQTPTLAEALNVLIWRQADATTNSIEMAARHYYSHKQLHKKSGSMMREMLLQKGVNWNDYPDYFKRGTFIQRKKISRCFSLSEIDKLPLKHLARKIPTLEVVRTAYVTSNIQLLKIKNPVEFTFEGATPLVKT